MADKPILFSAPMIRALLGGRKTQTRRILKDQPGDLDKPFMMDDGSWHVTDSKGGHMSPLAVRFRKGDRLWVRENWYAAYSADDVKPRDMDATWKVCPAVDWNYADWGIKGRLRPGIHMPRWASRLTLTVTDVRVQRLLEITPADCIAEGIWAPATSFTIDCETRDPRDDFQALWNTINGAGAWDANPFVVALTFTVERRNIDALSHAAGASVSEPVNPTL